MTFDDLVTSLQNRFPEAEFLHRQSDAGMRFLNVWTPRGEVAIEWKKGQPFGLSFLEANCDPLEGLYSAPDEVIESAEEVVEKVVTALLRTTSPRT